MAICADCKHGGVYGDPFSPSYLEYHCSKRQDIMADIGEPTNSPNVIELRRRVKEECLDFSPRRLTRSRRAKIYISVGILSASMVGYFTSQIPSFGLWGIAAGLGTLLVVWMVACGIEGELGNF